jgi:hypothetical protein
MAKKPTDEFRVPSLAEASPAYAALLQKQVELQDRQSALREERRALERQLSALPQSTVQVSSRVAEILGDEQDSAPMLRKQIAGLRSEESDLEAALEITLRRILEAKGQASTLVIATARDEYRRRVAAVTKAASALHEARMEYLDLRWQFEAQDVSWTALGPLSIGFLGDHTDGQLVRLIKDGGANV